MTLLHFSKKDVDFCLMFWALFLIPFFLSAEPPRQVPEDLYTRYTMGGIIPVHDMYLDNSYPPDHPIIFDAEEIDRMVEMARSKLTYYYGITDAFLFTLLDRYAPAIKGSSVAVIGSTIPWYESVALAYGGAPCTIEYNKIISTHPRLQVSTVEEFEANPRKFHVIFCISSVEHDGLGRYGDPLNPDGDLETMRKLKAMLHPNGLLFLSVPVGRDSLYWNAHRVYGQLRLPLLFEGWEWIDSAGFAESDILFHGVLSEQPVFLLTPKLK